MGCGSRAQAAIAPVRINATTDAAQAGVCDLVIIATKGMHVESAAGAARQLVGPDTLVLPIQNGLGGPERGRAGSRRGAGCDRCRGRLWSVGRGAGSRSPRGMGARSPRRAQRARHTARRADRRRLARRGLPRADLRRRRQARLGEARLQRQLQRSRARCWSARSAMSSRASRPGRSHPAVLPRPTRPDEHRGSPSASTSRWPTCMRSPRGYQPRAPRCSSITWQDGAARSTPSTERFHLLLARSVSRRPPTRPSPHWSERREAGHAGRARRRPKRRLVAAGSRLKPLLRPHVDVGDQPAEVLAGVGQGVRGPWPRRRDPSQAARARSSRARRGGGEGAGRGAREGSAGAG